VTTIQGENGAVERRPLSDSYDIVVIGARAAGASTAMLLARCGYSVLMVDRAREGTDTVSTHTLLRSGVLQMKRWGLLDQLADSGTPPIGRVTLGFGRELVPIDLKEEQGVGTLYAPRRTVLDPILVAAGVDEGVEYLSQTRALDLVRDVQGRVTGVVLEIGHSETAVSARMVVGADGVWSQTAAKVDAAEYASHPPANLVRYTYFRGIETDGIYFQFTRGVNTGLIPTNHGETLVYMGVPSTMAAEIRADTDGAFLREAIRSHPRMASAIRGGTRVGPYRGTDGLPGFLKRPYGPGWALVGDAGYTKDPISAHGISDALRDAELSSRAIDVALTDPRRESEAFAGYQRERDRLSVEMLDVSAELAGYEWDEARASTLMRRISLAVKEECEMLVDLPEWPAVRLEMAG
jgi:2-polyprenyl-6-methoxyphenol hydroxylase-like FAD-dependent oxidoreductase